jgi:hypothetical protein
MTSAFRETNLGSASHTPTSISNSQDGFETVIASEAKQSIAKDKGDNGLLRRFAPRNDDRHASAIPRREAPEVCMNDAPKKTEGVE